MPTIWNSRNLFMHFGELYLERGTLNGARDRKEQFILHCTYSCNDRNLRMQSCPKNTYCSPSGSPEEKFSSAKKIFERKNLLSSAMSRTCCKIPLDKEFRRREWSVHPPIHRWSTVEKPVPVTFREDDEGILPLLPLDWLVWHARVENMNPINPSSGRTPGRTERHPWKNDAAEWKLYDSCIDVNSSEDFSRVAKENEHTNMRDVIPLYHGGRWRSNYVRGKEYLLPPRIAETQIY